MREIHPYGVFIPKKPKAMLIGSFPIGKFTNPDRRHEIKEHELDFFFGGEKNLLWKLLGKVFRKNVHTAQDVIEMLEEKGLGIGDVIISCKRKNGGGSDSDLYDIEWNTELYDILMKHNIKTLYFTGKKVEGWYHRLFPQSKIKEVYLISPSGQSLRGLGANPEFKAWVKKHPNEDKINFILQDYRKKFKTIG
jgi:G:T/U-mismatch repair DNA glycosylase